MIICFAFGILVCLGQRFYLIGQNKKRDEASSMPDGVEMRSELMLNLMDKTDKQIPKFRYVY